jgi:hypothetical protein
MQEIEPPAFKPDHSWKRLALTIGRNFFANRLLFGLIIAFLAACFIRIHRPWTIGQPGGSCQPFWSSWG